MKVDNANTKIFHGIIKDLSTMVEALRVENDNMNDLILDNQKLNNKIKEFKTLIYYKDISIYFLMLMFSIKYIY